VQKHWANRNIVSQDESARRDIATPQRRCNVQIAARLFGDAASAGPFPNILPW